MLNPVWPDQVRKHPKNAPGGQVLDPTRYEIGGKVRLVGRFQAHTDEKTQIPPQKKPYTWMNDRKSKVPPQKRPQTWTDCQKSQVPPQKQPYM